MKIYKDIINYDHKDRIIYEENKNGFWERTTYNENTRIKTVVTHYPNGITETEQYVMET